MEKQLQELISIMKKREIETKLPKKAEGSAVVDTSKIEDLLEKNYELTKKVAFKKESTTLDNLLKANNTLLTIISDSMKESTAAQKAAAKAAAAANSEAFKDEQDKEKDRKLAEDTLNAIKDLKGKEGKPEEKKSGLLGSIMTLVGMFGGIGKFLSSIKNLMAMFKEFGFINGLIRSFSAAFPKLTQMFKVVGGLFSKIGGLVSFVGPLLKMVGRVFVVFQVFMSAFKGVSAFLSEGGSFFDKLKAGLAAALGSLTDFIPDLINMGLELFGIAWKTDFLSGSWWKEKIGILIDLFSQYFDVITTPFTMISELFTGSGTFQDRLSAAVDILFEGINKFFDLINPFKLAEKAKSFFSFNSKEQGSKNSGGSKLTGSASSAPGKSTSDISPSMAMMPAVSTGSASPAPSSTASNTPSDTGSGIGTKEFATRDENIDIRSVVSAAPNVQFNGMDPGTLENFTRAAAEYKDRTGKIVNVNSAFRTRADQEKLYKENPALAAKPGTSLHESGTAIDINSADANHMDKLGLLKHFRLDRPMWPGRPGGKKEAWHLQSEGAYEKWTGKVIKSPGKPRSAGGSAPKLEGAPEVRGQGPTLAPAEAKSNMMTAVSSSMQAPIAQDIPVTPESTPLDVTAPIANEVPATPTRSKMSLFKGFMKSALPTAAAGLNEAQSLVGGFGGLVGAGSGILNVANAVSGKNKQTPAMEALNSASMNIGQISGGIGQGQGVIGMTSGAIQQAKNAGNVMSSFMSTKEKSKETPPPAAPVIVSNSTTNVNQRAVINSTNPDAYFFGASAEYQSAV